MDLRRGHFLTKMYAKMKELGPVGEGMCPARPPPRSANDMSVNSTQSRLCALDIIVQDAVCDSVPITCQIQINLDKLGILVPCPLCNVCAILKQMI